MKQFKLGISNIEYQILIGRDGDQYCALLGNDLQDGYSGFGPDIPSALQDLTNTLKFIYKQRLK